MKHNCIFLLLISSLTSFAQPQAINYQGVARNAAGQALLNQNIGLQLSILDSTASGQTVYVETQSTTTNNSGLFNLSIGTGTIVSGVFANIAWGIGDKWLKIEMDTTGGNNYLLIGTSQFLSVPYTLFSSNATNAANGLPAGGAQGQTLTFCNGWPRWTNNGECSVTICSQELMIYNLDVSNYRNGDPIPHVTDPLVWIGLTTGAWCWYNNDSATYASTYGKLYNWYAVNDARGLAPTGWHVPTDAELTTLETCLGGYSTAGGNMKETGTTHWTSPNTGATNSSGFTALPGGYCNYAGTFYYIGSFGRWWSSTEFSSVDAWDRNLNYNNGNIDRYLTKKSVGFSVRCLKD